MHGRSVCEYSHNMQNVSPLSFQTQCNLPLPYKEVMLHYIVCVIFLFPALHVKKDMDSDRESGDFIVFWPSDMTWLESTLITPQLQILNL